MRCTVEDVMTRDVVCAREDTPYKELVRLLATRRVSAVPVVDGRRRVLGVVSETDLLRKQEQPARRAVGRLSVLGRGRDRAKARATVARELMSRPAITIGPRATLAERRGGCVPTRRAARGDASRDLRRRRLGHRPGGAGAGRTRPPAGPAGGRRRRGRGGRARAPGHPHRHLGHDRAPQGVRPVHDSWTYEARAIQLDSLHDEPSVRATG